MAFNVISSVVVLRSVKPLCVLYWHSCRLCIINTRSYLLCIIHNLPHTFLSFQDSDTLHTACTRNSLYIWQRDNLCVDMCFKQCIFKIYNFTSVLCFTTSCNISTYPFLVMRLPEDGNKIGRNMQDLYYVSSIKQTLCIFICNFWFRFHIQLEYQYFTWESTNILFHYDAKLTLSTPRFSHSKRTYIRL